MDFDALLKRFDLEKLDEKAREMKRREREEFQKKKELEHRQKEERMMEEKTRTVGEKEKPSFVNEMNRMDDLSKDDSVNRTHDRTERPERAVQEKSLSERLSAAEKLRVKMKNVNKMRYDARIRHLQQFKEPGNNKYRTIEIKGQAQGKTQQEIERGKTLTMQIYDTLKKTQLPKEKGFTEDREGLKAHTVMLLDHNTDPSQAFETKNQHHTKIAIIGEDGRIIGEPVPTEHVMERYQAKTPMEAMDIGAASMGSMSIPEAFYSRLEEYAGQDLFEFAGGSDYALDKDGHVKMAVYQEDEHGYQEKEYKLDNEGHTHEEKWTTKEHHEHDDREEDEEYEHTMTSAWS